MTRRFTVTDDQEKKVLEIYKRNKYIGQIATKVGIDRHAVSQVLRDHPESGYDPRTSRRHKYFYDENFFTRIDTEAKAYYFGFFATDGWFKVENDNYLAWAISIHEKDVDILETLSKIMGPKSPDVIYRPNTNKVKLIFHSVKMCRDLRSKGLSNGKSYDLEDITMFVPRKLHHHFARGVFDGDGCWTDARYRLRWSLRGTYNFLYSIKNILPAETHIYGKVNDWKSLVTNKNDEAIRLGQWIYKDANIFLDRKYKIYKSGYDRRRS